MVQNGRFFLTLLCGESPAWHALFAAVHAP